MASAARSTKKVFPGYVMVEMAHGRRTSWYVVRNTPGVTGLRRLRHASRSPLEDAEVKRSCGRCGRGAAEGQGRASQRPERPIVDGPFTDFIGLVDDINPEKGKVRVLVSFFGRETPVELDFLQVEQRIAS